MFQIIKAEQKVNKSLELTDEGKEVAERGSHEALVYHVIPADGIAQAEIMVGVSCLKVRCQLVFATIPDVTSFNYKLNL